MVKKNFISFIIVIGIISFCVQKGYFVYSESHAQKARLFSFEGINQTLTDSENSYDVRDRFNRPINNLELRSSLRTLFISSLYQLLYNSEIYSTSKLLQILYRKFNLLSSSITKAFKIFAQQVFGIVVFSQIKKLIGILILLFLSALIVFTSHILYPFFFFTPKAKVAPLVLRC